MKMTATKISDAKLIEPKMFGDERGFFIETWNEKVFRDAGIDTKFVPHNHSRLVKNILRGLHNKIKHLHGKLIRGGQVEIFDVVVDLFVGSDPFEKWIEEYLSEDNKCMLWILLSFADNFLVTNDTADFQYKCTDFHGPESGYCIAWDNGEVGVFEDVNDSLQPLLSEKDRCGLNLSEMLIELKNEQSYRVV